MSTYIIVYTIASAIYDLSLSYFRLVYDFVRDKPQINHADILKHSHITLVSIHDLSAGLAAKFKYEIAWVIMHLLYSYYLLGFSILAPLRFPSPSSSPDTLLRLMRYL